MNPASAFSSPSYGLIGFVVFLACPLDLQTLCYTGIIYKNKSHTIWDLVPFLGFCALARLKRDPMLGAMTTDQMQLIGLFSYRLIIILFTLSPTHRAAPRLRS